MAFQQFKLDIATEQTRGIFNTYVYQTESDSILTVRQPGYFAASRFDLVDGDGCGALIRCCCADGFFEGFVDADGSITPVDPIDNIEEIIEIGVADSPYSMMGTEDIILCTGAVTINAIPITIATKSFIVDADGGTVTMNPAGLDAFEIAIITDGNAAKYAPKQSTGEWRTV
jgi:hypothetical protein